MLIIALLHLAVPLGAEVALPHLSMYHRQINPNCFRWGSGLPLADYLPRFLLGGLLMQMGGGMLMDWAFLVMRRLQRTQVRAVSCPFFIDF